jgi:histidine triad (HIT) family protein
MSDCLFCKIASNEIPADVVFETDEILAFRDIDPKAPTHVLVITRQHFENAAELANANKDLAAQVLQAITDVATLEGLAEGYRIVTNTGSDGGQSVNHVHFHLLGGRSLNWPPG